MRSLIKANLGRMFWTPSFWILVAAQLVFTILVIHYGGAFDLPYGGDAYKQRLEYHMSRSFIWFPFFQAVLVSFFLGAEKKEGAVRNKLIVGHTRREIYFSNLIACLVGTAILYGAWFLGSLCEMRHLKVWGMTPGAFLLFLLLYLFSAAAGTGVYVMLAQICKHGSGLLMLNLLLTAMALATAVVVFLVLWLYPERMGALWPGNLKEFTKHPEEPWVYDTVFYVSVPGEQYVGGLRRKLDLAVESILPSGIHIWLMDTTLFTERTHYYEKDGLFYVDRGYWRGPDVELTSLGCICGSTALLVVSSALGFRLFRRKEIN